MLNNSSPETQIHIKPYLDQFHVLGTDGDLNCTMLSQILYSAILNKFQTPMNDDESIIFKEYQIRVYDLVEDLRECEQNVISCVLDFLGYHNPYLADIVIMQWVLPRSYNYFSTKMYDAKYKENIENYNHKLVKLIDHTVMKNFCVETLTKTNNVPVHCIDYLWFYMNGLSLVFAFHDWKNAGYIGMTELEVDDQHKETYMEFSLNAEYLLNLGLGKVSYSNDPGSKGLFRSLLQKFFTQTDLVENLMTIPTKKNYLKQLNIISKNIQKYFGADVNIVSTSIKE